MRAPHLASLCALLALGACAPDYAGPEEVKDLRLLAVQAEPPEIGAAADAAGAGWPAPATALRSLVAHPQFALGGAAQAVILHLACTPAPGDLAGTACTRLSELSEPAALLQLVSPASLCMAEGDHGRGEVNGITFSGLEACDRAGCAPFAVPLDPANPGATAPMPSPRYALPDDFALSALPGGHLQRLLGVDVVDLALVVEASPAELAPATAVGSDCEARAAVLANLGTLWPGRDHLAALKWTHVRGPDMPAENPPNHNPVVAAIAMGGAPLPSPGGVPAAVTAGARRPLLPAFPAPDGYETLRERYQRYDTSGDLVDTRDETWAYSWFTTGGELDSAHTDSGDPKNTWKPGKGRALVWLVVRDLRGGMAWTAGEVQAP